MKKACVIIGAAPCGNPLEQRAYIEAGSFVICADGGYRNAQQMGVSPDLLIGDFDSAPYRTCPAYRSRPSRKKRTTPIPCLR